ncbi:Family of serine hydrolases 3 [Coemansia sp. RSA 2049]|nr:Family of serine hydrolases 3 [Coemansia sp. RSA 2049]
MDSMARAEAERNGKTLGRTYRGWYSLTNADPEITAGVDTSIEYLDKVMESQGPFDGILGFSQGGLMAVVMCAVLERRKAVANNASPDQPERSSHPLFRFAIICSGYKLQDAKWQDLYDATRPLATRSLHLYGVLDPMIRFSKSMELQKCFANPESLCFEGAHFIPKTHDVILAISQFIKQFQSN